MQKTGETKDELEECTVVPTFVDQGVSCYQLEGGDFKNDIILCQKRRHGNY